MLPVEREFLEEERAQRHAQQMSLRSTPTHVIKRSSRNLNGKKKPKLPAKKRVRRVGAGKVKLATGNFPLNYSLTELGSQETYKSHVQSPITIYTHQTAMARHESWHTLAEKPCAVTDHNVH